MVKELQCVSRCSCLPLHSGAGACAQTWAKGEHAPKRKERPASQYYTRAEEDKEFMRKEFLEKLPKMPSHYCRSSSTKQYLEPIIPTLAELYRLYQTKCAENGSRPLNRKCLARSSTKWACLCSALARMRAIPASAMRSAIFLMRTGLHTWKRRSKQGRKRLQTKHVTFDVRMRAMKGPRLSWPAWTCRQGFCRHACKHQRCTANKSYALTISLFSTWPPRNVTVGPTVTVKCRWFQHGRWEKFMHFCQQHCSEWRIILTMYRKFRQQ